MAARILFLLAFLLATYTIISANDEGDALLALKQGLKDPGNFLASWDPSLVNPCTWLHVTCDSNVRAIRLDLGHLNLSGSLNPQLGSLQNLQYLELSENNLEGKIPDEIGNLANLVSLDLNDNLFAGEIPKSFGKLKSLRFLRLNNNKLRGSIPRELTGLSNLKVFDVSNNDLSGVIPTDGPFANFPREAMLITEDYRRPELLLAMLTILQGIVFLCYSFSL